MGLVPAGSLRESLCAFPGNARGREKLCSRPLGSPPLSLRPRVAFGHSPGRVFGNPEAFGTAMDDERLASDSSSGDGGPSTTTTTIADMACTPFHKAHRWVTNLAGAVGWQLIGFIGSSHFGLKGKYFWAFPKSLRLFAHTRLTLFVNNLRRFAGLSGARRASVRATDS